ncbi:hypothetical protein LSH36_83g03023 [Paralvinella palmiformis]|uniref:Aminopeptidase n=1 Tax=Paralvinella palmiformis TaxID=53620 RepID=A0AAD9K1Q6_9ANNE|nr:hypothetical protein LSH36_83g03023 [Paralvinella palmiformis]
MEIFEQRTRGMPAALNRQFIRADAVLLGQQTISRHRKAHTGSVKKPLRWRAETIIRHRTMIISMPSFTVFEYYIHVTPYLKGSRPHFFGSLQMNFLCHRIANIIELHSKHLAVNTYSLINDESDRSITVSRFSEMPEDERISFKTTRSMEPGKMYSLVVDYEGLLNQDGSTIGVFSVNYTSPQNGDGAAHYMMGTTLRPNHARSLFPCIDSPDHKAKFRVSVTREPSMRALSNTDLVDSTSNGSWVTDTFEMTEYLSPFHLVIVLFPNEDWVVSASADVHGVSCDLWMTNQAAANGRTALRLVARDIQFMEEYTGFTMPFKKMDFFAFKDYHTSAFEHPGLITLKTSVIRNALIETFDSTAKTVAHELGHQWFGNLVTIRTWGDLWISEGITCLVSFKALRNHHPRFREFGDYYHVTQLLTMRQEKKELTVPLYQRFEDRPTYRDVYQPLTWVKGQAVATVLEKYVGEESFRGVLRTILREKRWGSISIREFLDYLESASDSFSASSGWQWFGSAGYPLVTVNRSLGLLRFRCYLLNGETDRRLWPLNLEDLGGFGGPLMLGYELKYENGTVRHGELTFVGEESEVELVLDNSEQVEYFVLNTEGLYARVLYDDVLWRKLIANINSDHLSEYEHGLLSLIEDASVLYQYGLMDGEVFTELSNRYCHRHREAGEEDDYITSYSYDSFDATFYCWMLWSL